MAIDNKTCIFCRHFCFSSGVPDYSEYTPGTDASIGCDKDLYSEYLTEIDQEKFVELLQTAKQCEHFEYVDYSE